MELSRTIINCEIATTKSVLHLVGSRPSSTGFFDTKNSSGLAHLRLVLDWFEQGGVY